MTVYRTQVVGTSAPCMSTTSITRYDQNQGNSHSLQNLTECSCPALDRFSSHGNAIRTAYEDAVVNAISSFYPTPDHLLRTKVHVAVMGSGGLLQEALWLQKFYQTAQPVDLVLHLVDTYYAENTSAIASLAKFAKDHIVPKYCTLTIQGWKSCADLANSTIKPDLVIGMDTENATPDAKRYQWALQAGDIEKTLIVRWEGTPSGQPQFKLYSRKGAYDELQCRTFSDYKLAAYSIKQAGHVSS